MKVRMGFVSNSSSSSFCGWGIEFNCEEICELLNIKFKDDIYHKIWDVLNNLIKKSKSITYLIAEEEVIIGREYPTIKENETGLNFKENTKSELKKLFPELDLELKLIYREVFT